MASVLVTGIAGFLGKNLAKTLLNRGHDVIGTAHSEVSVRDFEISVSGSSRIPVYSFDIADCQHSIKRILKNHRVDYVVHSAALKHVGICENNPTRAIDVNIIGSRNLITSCLEGNVKNVIGISTDKSINPSCVYGMTKKLMEEMLIESGYSVFQGVNFLFSTGSVLDIWDKLMKENKEILVNSSARRYFCIVDDVSNKIADSLDAKGRFTVDKCYLISIQDLQVAFSKYHNYWNVNSYKPLGVEKNDEDLPLGGIKVENPDSEFVLNLLRQHYANRNRA